MNNSPTLNNSLTGIQWRAYNALSILIMEEGVTTAADIYADVLAHARLETFRERHDLTLCGGTACLGRLFDRRCRHHSGRSGETPHIPPGNAHPSVWKRDGKPVAYVVQPYKEQLTVEVLEELEEFCHHYGLTSRVLEEESFHYPGRTTLIMIERLP